MLDSREYLPNEIVPAKEINTIKAELKPLTNITVVNGCGLTLRKSSSSITLGFDKELTAGGAPAEDYSGGTVLELSHTNPTVAWAKDTNKCPVKVIDVNYLEYSDSTHAFTQYYRELTYDKGGNLTAISAESSRVIFTAVACPSS